MKPEYGKKQPWKKRGFLIMGKGTPYCHSKAKGKFWLSIHYILQVIVGSDGYPEKSATTGRSRDKKYGGRGKRLEGERTKRTRPNTSNNGG